MAPHPSGCLVALGPRDTVGGGVEPPHGESCPLTHRVAFVGFFSKSTSLGAKKYGKGELPWKDLVKGVTDRTQMLGGEPREVLAGVALEPPFFASRQQHLPSLASNPLEGRRINLPWFGLGNRAKNSQPLVGLIPRPSIY